MPHENFQPCLNACNACAVACNHCAVSCLQERSVDEMRKCIELDMDCAQICAFATAAMSRGKPVRKGDFASSAPGSATIAVQNALGTRRNTARIVRSPASNARRRAAL